MADLFEEYRLGPGWDEMFADGVMPRRIIATSAHFLRQAAGINPPNGVRIHVAGVDLIREEQGTFRVLEDNVRIPSGVSYVMENRRAMAQVLPEVFAATRILPVESYPGMLLRALRAAAPVGVGNPTVVVLSPGVFNSAYFEHALIAREGVVVLQRSPDVAAQRDPPGGAGRAGRGVAAGPHVPVRGLLGHRGDPVRRARQARGADRDGDVRPWRRCRPAT